MSNITPIGDGSVNEALRAGSPSDRVDALGRLLNHPAGRRLTFGWFQRIMGDEFKGVGGSVKSTLPLQYAKAVYAAPTRPAEPDKREPYELGVLATVMYPEGTIWREVEPAPRDPRESDVEALAKIAMGGELPERPELVGASISSVSAAGADGAFQAALANMPDVASVFDPTSPRS